LSEDAFGEEDGKGRTTCTSIRPRAVREGIDPDWERPRVEEKKAGSNKMAWRERCLEGSGGLPYRIAVDCLWEQGEKKFLIIFW